jgi:hypothetical protein
MVNVKAQTGDQEASLKAVFIYNFIKYIDWDNLDDKPEFIIGIIGSSPVTEYLTEIAKTNKAKDKTIRVKYISRIRDINECQILFIPGKTSFSLSSILDRAGKGVLTISEQKDYAQKGTAFNFVIVNDKLKFEANLKAIDAAGLKASSQLLKLAIIIN